MDRLKSLEFLQNCLNAVNNMTEEEAERARLIYREEMENTGDFASEFEVVLPIETQISFECDNKSKKIFLDYKMSKYKEVSTELIECMAA